MEALTTLIASSHAKKNLNCFAKCKGKANRHSCTRLKEKAIEDILKAEHKPELNGWEPDYNQPNN